MPPIGEGNVFPFTRRPSPWVHLRSIPPCITRTHATHWFEHLPSTQETQVWSPSPIFFSFFTLNSGGHRISGLAQALLIRWAAHTQCLQFRPCLTFFFLFSTNSNAFLNIHIFRTVTPNLTCYKIPQKNMYISNMLLSCMLIISQITFRMQP